MAHCAAYEIGATALSLKQLFFDGGQSLAIFDGQPVEGARQSLSFPHIPIQIRIAMQQPVSLRLLVLQSGQSVQIIRCWTQEFSASIRARFALP